jgi:hypothetical protein
MEGAGLSFEFEAASSEIQKDANFDAGGGEVVDQLNLVGGNEVENSFKFEQNASWTSMSASNFPTRTPS